jgi:protein-tyrosine phosphatase
MAEISPPAADAHRFGPAAPGEEHVYGACAPGWHSAASHDRAVDDWLEFLAARGVDRICCLVPGRQLDRDGATLDRYRAAVGSDAVVHAPIPDNRLADPATLRDGILPFLDRSVAAEAPVVVHCLDGVGRTGQVLAAWLVHARDYRPAAAIETVQRMGRDPTVAVQQGPATRRDLLALLGAVD